MSLKRSLYLFILWCFILSAALSHTQSETPPNAPQSPILAGSEDSYPPFCIINEKGEADGFSVELLKAALKAVGQEITFEIGPWNEVKASLSDGGIQVLPLVGRTPEREKEFDFSFPYLTMHGTIVVRGDEKNIRSYQDLKGKRVAVMAEDNAEEFLRRKDFGATIVTTENFETALLSLVHGQNDAVVIQKLVALQLMNRLKLDSLITVGSPEESFKQSFCFAVKEGDGDLLELLNEGLSIVIADGTFRQLHAQWFSLIDAYEKQRERISIGCLSDFPPYAYLDENGTLTGFNVELTYAIAHELGLSVDLYPGTMGENLSKLSRQDIDLIQGRSYSPQRDAFSDFSTAHTVISHVIVIRVGGNSLENLAELKGRSIVVMEGNIMHEVAIDNGLEDSLTLVKTQEEALKLLSEGQFDCALTARIPTLFWIEKHNWNNLRLSGNSVSSPEYCYQANDGNSELLQQFSEGMAALEVTGEYRKIYSKWLGVYEKPTLGMAEILKYLLFILIPVLALMAAGLIWSRSLQSQVRVRTRELQQEIDVRHRTEQALKKSDDNLRTTLDSIGDAVIATDIQGTITRMNPVAEQLTGWLAKDASGQSIDKILHVIDFQTGLPIDSLVTRVLETEKVTEGGTGTMLLSKRGSRHHISNTGAPIRAAAGSITGVVLVFRDVTEEFRIQEEFQKMKRLESLGVLAGGIAHDFNNILTMIFGNISLAKLEISRQEAGFDFLQNAESSMERARSLTSQLLTFAKGGTPVTENVGIQGLLEEIVSFDLSGSNVKAVFEFQEGLLLANVDKGQIQQVFSNLTINSKESMPDGGHLYISLKSIAINDSDLPGLQDGKYVEIVFRDEGYGIRETDLVQIFDPYFSTKDSGSGLGLAITYSIIKKHGGFIFVESVVGQGTTMTTYLPQAEKLKLVEQMPMDKEIPSMPPSSRILVMDDEEMIRNLAVAMLSKKGYLVDAAPEGGQAVEMYSQALEKGEPYQVTIMDLTVPGGMGGQMAARKILDVHPSARLIVSSGYADDPVMSDYYDFGFKGIVAKPYSSEVLVNAINKAMFDSENTG